MEVVDRVSVNQKIIALAQIAEFQPVLPAINLGGDIRITPLNRDLVIFAA
jgi:hypothetical protein